MADSLSSDELQRHLNKLITAMQQEPAKDLVRIVNILLRDFKKKLFDPMSDAEMLQDFFVRMEAAMAVHPLWSGSTALEIDASMEGLEKYVLTKLYERTFGVYEEDKERDELLSLRMRALQFIKPEYLELPVRIDEASLCLAQNALKEINKFKAPYEKLQCILNCCKIVSNVLSTVVGVAGADDFTPALIYTVIKANPEQLASNLAFIERFRRSSKLVSESQYYFIQLQGAAAFVETLDASSLKVDPDEFIAHMLAEGAMTEEELLMQSRIHSASHQRHAARSSRPPQQPSNEGYVPPAPLLEGMQLPAPQQQLQQPPSQPMKLQQALLPPPPPPPEVDLLGGPLLSNPAAQGMASFPGVDMTQAFYNEQQAALAYYQQQHTQQQQPVQPPPLHAGPAAYPQQPAVYTPLAPPPPPTTSFSTPQYHPRPYTPPQPAGATSYPQQGLMMAPYSGQRGGGWGQPAAGSSQQQCSNTAVKQDSGTQTHPPRPAIKTAAQLEAEGLRLVLASEAAGLLAGRHPFLYAAAESLTLRDVRALLAAYKELVLRYEMLSAGCEYNAVALESCSEQQQVAHGGNPVSVAVAAAVTTDLMSLDSPQHTQPQPHRLPPPPASADPPTHSSSASVVVLPPLADDEFAAALDALAPQAAGEASDAAEVLDGPLPENDSWDVQDAGSEYVYVQAGSPAIAAVPQTTDEFSRDTRHQHLGESPVHLSPLQAHVEAEGPAAEQHGTVSRVVESTSDALSISHQNLDGSGAALEDGAFLRVEAEGDQGVSGVSAWEEAVHVEPEGRSEGTPGSGTGAQGGGTEHEAGVPCIEGAVAADVVCKTADIEAEGLAVQREGEACQLDEGHVAGIGDPSSQVEVVKLCDANSAEIPPDVLTAVAGEAKVLREGDLPSMTSHDAAVEFKHGGGLK